ncbi:MAG: phosphate-starvation-inducible E [Gallionellales bacterium 35-53-114]|jgi:protein PsiE|nr:MAG: phosphate-starvation-inducible E [Gallionellales bacterium 35-53-114]OYZ63948.1 MAG: phosphate-starvation-inducible E [Gallionellales bacterium 24-53-125]OZB09223.1 MAG: phosphate-starvation-inducible E [Gallionellales bacterium 39-52-133]HQS59179.1 phosphate-starvation-inducible PsiE family protein [Gallionellaceae bacterium]HQS75915.1 phosphate-starvation-inducible PsiE family protein [Gallionellaceae bacterium]
MKRLTIREFNQRVISLVENIGLLVIGIATVFAMGAETMTMIRAMQVTLTDLLLLFLYLEVLAMVGLYYQSGKLPVRFPLYIGMVALARYLILDMKDMEDWRMLAVTGSILLLTLAVFLIRYGHVRFPYPGDDTADLRHADRQQD